MNFWVVANLILTFWQHHEQILIEGYDTEYDDIGLDDQFPQTCLASMKALFADEGFQRVVKRGNEYALHNNFQ